MIEIGISNSLSRHGMELPPFTVKRRVVVITFLGFHTFFLAYMNITANWNCSLKAGTLCEPTLVHLLPLVSRPDVSKEAQ